MRLFFAIELPDPLREHLVAVRKRLEPTVRMAYTRPENLHLTLKFLGEVADGVVASVCAAAAALPKRDSLELQAGGLVCFPEQGKVRMAGAVVTAGPALSNLVDDLENACQRLGFARERRAFVPHITLARARVPLASAVRAKLAEAVAGAFPGPKATVGQYVLMESDLSRGGATYRAVARFDL